MECKFCGSENTIKNGVRKDIQDWLCKDCNHKFRENWGLIGMKTPRVVVGNAIQMYYNGIPMTSIDEQIKAIYDHKVNSSTIWRWVMKYSNRSYDFLSHYPAKLGDVWMVDETQVKIRGRPAWFWDVIDTDTRFLVGTHLSYTRTISDVTLLFKKCKVRSLTKPKVIISDSMPAYHKGINKVFYSTHKDKRTEHILMQGMDKPININMLERFHGTIKQRYKVMRGLKTFDSTQTILDGFVTHYNYFKPHQALKDKTPSEMAGVTRTYDNWISLLEYMDRESTNKPIRANISKEILNHYDE